MSIAIGLRGGVFVPELREQPIERAASGPSAGRRLGAFLGRHARGIAMAQLLVAFGGVGLSLYLWAGQRFATPPVSFIEGVGPLAAHFPMALAYAVIGTVLASRQPRNAIGWLLLCVGTSSSFVPAVHNMVAAAGSSFVAPGPVTVLSAWLVSSFHLPLVAALLIVVFLIFPTGHAPSPRWWIGGVLAVGGALAVGTGLAIKPDGLLWYPQLANPLAAPAWADALSDGLQVAGLVCVIAGLLVATAAMIVRYRTYTPVERRPLKWIAVAIVILAATGGALLVVRYGLPVAPGIGELVLTSTVIGSMALPIAAGFGMLRHHLFDTDLILNHALVYVPLSGLMTGLYAASVALFQRLFVALTGDTSDVAIILTTLILASTFTPVRKVLEQFVDRHFKPAARVAAEAPGAAQVASAEVAATLPALAAAMNAEIPAPQREAEPSVAALVAELRRIEERLATVESGRSRRRRGVVA